FFSSRRRHTRFSRDWSSDVCSSDLEHAKLALLVLQPLEWFVENRYGVCGTPDDAIALIERLQDKQGEFGVFLHQAHNWADWEATKRSYELYARYVIPHFSRANASRAASFQWCGDHRAEFRP